MVNTNKLKGRMAEKGLTLDKLAFEVGLSSCTLGKKIRNLAHTTLEEAGALSAILDIPKNEIVDYFFQGLEV